MAFNYRGDSRYLRRHPVAGHGDGLTYGAACVPGPFRELMIIFSDGEGWEHVSVSTPGRPPNWQEMCFVKDLFWAEDDVVMQLHPAKAVYVNNHPHCLHLWRPQGRAIPEPPLVLVGTK